MLSKKICRHCINSSTRRWSEGKDRSWDNGKVYCISLADFPRSKRPSGSVWLDVTGKPPNRCMYLLEQSMYDAWVEKKKNKALGSDSKKGEDVGNIEKG